MEPVAQLDRCFDLEGLALSWYGQPLARLVARDGLVFPADWPERLSGLPSAGSGHLVAASPGLLADELSELVVVGGPCIGDCNAFPTLEALFDSVQTMLVAQALQAPCVVYLGDREEALARGGGKSWLKLGERVAAWLEGVATSLDAQATIVRTSSSAHEAALEASGRPALEAGAELLDAAFHLGDEPKWTGDEDSRAVTARVIEAHLPSVVGAHVAIEAPTVLMTQNLQQLGAWRLARELAGGTGVEYLAHWPVPSVSAALRMYRAEVWDKVQASSLEQVAAGTLPGLASDTHDYFAGWLDAELRERLVSGARTGPR